MTTSNTISPAQKKLDKAKIHLDLADFDKNLLEKSPAGVFVCNRLVRGFDEWMLLDLLSRQFEKVSLIHPAFWPAEKSLQPYIFAGGNLKKWQEMVKTGFEKKILARVESGEAVILVVDFSENFVGKMEQEFVQRQVLKTLRKSGVPVIPIHLSTDSPRGSVFRRIFPLQNFLPGQPIRVNVRVGSPVFPTEIALFPKTKTWVKFLQAHIFSLGSPLKVSEDFFKKNEPQKPQPLAPPVAQIDLEKDIAELRPEQKIASRGQFDIFVAPFHALPNVVFEIGRLREMTFRAVGEGTGQPRDLDAYDIYYQQLIVWDREKKQIVGGYRIGEGDLIFRRFGLNGFYISSLFKIKTALFPVLEQSVELGRSYIVPEYQKHRLPLFLLWKGILHFMLAHPQYRYLYGPVSISKYYSEVSKSVIVEFIQHYFFDKNLAKYVSPRKPFRFKNRDVDAKLLVEAMGQQFENLDEFVETIEPEHFKMPVLFKQYLKQNARFIAFNVDPNFSDCLDGLMILDIQNVPVSTIESLKTEK